MIDTIVRALNKWLEVNYHSKDGWFVGRQFEENTAFNAYKTLIAEIYYHIGTHNHLVVKQRYTVNKTTAQGNQEDKLYIALLSTIFSELEQIEEKINNVEQIPDTV